MYKHLNGLHRKTQHKGRGRVSEGLYSEGRGPERGGGGEGGKGMEEDFKLDELVDGERGEKIEAKNHPGAGGGAKGR